MKSMLFLVALFATSTLFAQDNDYTMYHVINLKAKAGHQQQLMQGLKAHNEKYHQEGASSVNVWQIRSGPRSASLNWVQGPLTWAHFDEELSDEHLADWRDNVAAHAEVGEWEYWRLVDGMQYIPEGFQARVAQITYWDIHEDKNDNARELTKKVVEFMKESKMPSAYQMYSNQANSGDGKDWAMIFFNGSWADRDQDSEWETKFDEMYGHGAWDDFLDEWRDVTDFKGNELHALMTDLSVADDQE